MAHHKSAKKRILANGRRAEVNTSRVGRIRTFLKRVETAISSGDKSGLRPNSSWPSLNCSAAPRAA
jgi:ribosomal protein S20